jgi:hypothetical protein
MRRSRRSRSSTHRAAVSPALGEGGDRDKAIVIKAIGHLVQAGQAELVSLEDGILLLRFSTGEAFRLGQDLVTRVAEAGNTSSD